MKIDDQQFVWSLTWGSNRLTKWRKEDTQVVGGVLYTAKNAKPVSEADSTNR